MVIENKTMDEERVLYGCENVTVRNCKFQGEADGESALKECGRVEAENCLFDLRYPLWHDRYVMLDGCEMTENCRAALWYSKNIVINDTKMYGIKALRECKHAVIKNSEIISPEFGWSTDCVSFVDVKATSEYFLLRAKNVSARGLTFKGKYSFQYVDGGIITDSTLDTKDAFWHTKNVTVKNCIVKGEYLGWYSENLTFVNCTIAGTQPLCYCKGLKLIDCKTENADLSFEYSEVDATIQGSVLSVKNPRAGKIVCGGVGELIYTKDSKYPCACKIITK